MGDRSFASFSEEKTLKKYGVSDDMDERAIVDQIAWALQIIPGGTKMDVFWGTIFIFLMLSPAPVTFVLFILWTLSTFYKIPNEAIPLNMVPEHYVRKP